MARKQVSIARRRALVARCEASDQAVRPFAIAQNIPYSTFYRWFQKFRKSQRRCCDMTVGTEIQIVELQVVDPPTVDPAPPPPTLELDLPGGSPLRFPQGVDPSYIAALIVAVGDAAAY